MYVPVPTRIARSLRSLTCSRSYSRLWLNFEPSRKRSLGHEHASGRARTRAASSHLNKGIKRLSAAQVEAHADLNDARSTRCPRVDVRVPGSAQGPRRLAMYARHALCTCDAARLGSVVVHRTQPGACVAVRVYPRRILRRLRLGSRVAIAYHRRRAWTASDPQPARALQRPPPATPRRCVLCDTFCSRPRRRCAGASARRTAPAGAAVPQERARSADISGYAARAGVLGTCINVRLRLHASGAYSKIRAVASY